MKFNIRIFCIEMLKLQTFIKIMKITSVKEILFFSFSTSITLLSIYKEKYISNYQYNWQYENL